jgi:hypothetical protein
MADKVWPKDRLGNDIKTGKMVVLQLPDPFAVFFVAEVKPATVLQGTEGSIPVNGEITFVWKMQIPFPPDGPVCMRAIVAETPEDQQKAVRLQ